MQIEEKQTITLRFWSNEENEERLIEENRKSLMNDAYTHIYEELDYGNTSGELCEVVVDNGEEYELRGWWEASTINI